MVAFGRALRSVFRTAQAPGSRVAAIEPVWTCVSPSRGWHTLSSQIRSKLYVAAPVTSRVEVATDVRRLPTLPSVNLTPSSARRLAILVPRLSSPIMVANVTSWPRRVRPTATLAGLPPTCSWAEPSGLCTTSINDSPITSVRLPFCNRTLVIGESLIDVVHSPDGSAQEHVGGSPANVAVGLTRLGHDVTFATMIGDDRRGTRIASLLAEEGVRLTEGSVGRRRTSVATSTLDVTGAATYSFDLIWELSVCQPLEGLTHVHTGSIAATLEPGACAVLKTLRSARPNATISYDPNVRPPLMGNAHEVRAKIEQLIRLSDVVKASDEDITWLYDGTPLSDVLRLWAQLGPALVVMTRGDKGAAIGLSLTGEIASVDAPVVEVVDTVGAGDSFMAGL